MNRTYISLIALLAIGITQDINAMKQQGLLNRFSVLGSNTMRQSESAASQATTKDFKTLYGSVQQGKAGLAGNQEKVQEARYKASAIYQHLIDNPTLPAAEQNAARRELDLANQELKAARDEQAMAIAQNKKLESEARKAFYQENPQLKPQTPTSSTVKPTSKVGLTEAMGYGY